MFGRREGGRPEIGYDESWYHATAKSLTEYPALAGSVTADVCIVGGGYTGLSAAIELAKRGMSVVLLEGHRIGAGASGRNGGVLGMGQRKDQDELEDMVGKDDARKLWQIACDANQLVKDRIAEYNIDCDLTAGEIHAAHRARYVPGMWEYNDFLAREYDYHDRRNITREEMRETLGTDVFFGGTFDARSGHVHPLNLALGLARAASAEGAKIYERTLVTEYERVRNDGVVAHTDRGRVSAKFLVLACNGYLGDLSRTAGWFQMPINNFVLATEPLGEERARAINRDNVAVVDTRFVVNYFHNSPDHRLIFGGGENYTPWFPRDIKAFVRKHMLEIYPELADVRIDYGWGGTLAITMRRMPHFGRIGSNVYFAQGYSGHGIAMANMGGKIVAEAIRGQAERFDIYAGIRHFPFPGGRLLRWPGLVAGMLYYALLDRL
ncbi:MAG: FAD-binding oxidoreductase [Pseudomonadales bacterium]|nr:FAD-binding oxidoreductase [Pseudomonadales bacterium]